jgi:hypothetical protein
MPGLGEGSGTDTTGPLGPGVTHRLPIALTGVTKTGSHGILGAGPE